MLCSSNDASTKHSEFTVAEEIGIGPWLRHGQMLYLRGKLVTVTVGTVADVPCQPVATDKRHCAQQAPVSAIDQCIRCSSPFVGSTPRPYCGNTTGMPPLQWRKVSDRQLHTASHALPCRQVAAIEGVPKEIQLANPLQADDRKG